MISKQLATVLIDAGVSIALLLMVRYLAPADLDLWRQIVIILQGVAVAYIGSTSYMQKAKLEADTDKQIAALSQPRAEVVASQWGVDTSLPVEPQPTRRYEPPQRAK